MRRSEFFRAVETEFPGRGSSLISDLVLTELGGRTATEALDQGVATRDVWLALCVEADVPVTRRHGAGRLEPRRR
ncbi:DUF3046 domain-containing protein [Microbacterium sp. SD291]|uniref:DUF3046 domain-containing protein n=1 Tax=Microbacterium sp. SD291 TaxID=2782007 RepID=UPI001A973EB0|nr:DUF3046 domain-containing protein [Microbacterium sp. SD291]MBO0979529.1 DUF3046 domain-containing protein [Microbacterium sp. SD291]